MSEATLGCIAASIPKLEGAAMYLQVAADEERGRRWLKLSSAATSVSRLVEELEQIVAEIHAPPAGE